MFEGENRHISGHLPPSYSAILIISGYGIISTTFATRPGLASFLSWCRNLIPEYVEIAIKRKAMKPFCHLSGSIARFALQPPDDSADQDMGELHGRQLRGHS